MGIHVFPILNPHPIPLGHPSALALSTLSHASNLNLQSVSHMIIYMFQCYCLKASHPRLLPQSPKVCSIHLCLFCSLAYRVIVVIFLNSIYMCQYTVLVFFFLAYLNTVFLYIFRIELKVSSLIQDFFKITKTIRLLDFLQ